MNLKIRPDIQWILQVFYLIHGAFLMFTEIAGNFVRIYPGENIVYRFARGGSWVDNSDFISSAYRYEVQRDSKNHSLGLRIALKVEK